VQENDKRDPLTWRIIGAAIEVHRELGPGLLESLYEDAFCYELSESGLSYRRQMPIPVEYKRRNIGNLIADVIVADEVIVELKAVDKLAPIHTTQMLTYLKVTDLNLSLLLNFNVKTLKDGGIKRFVL
jgi:GxxExxY protein